MLLKKIKNIIKNAIHAFFLNYLNELRVRKATIEQLIHELQADNNIFRSRPGVGFLIALYRYTADLEKKLPIFQTNTKRIYIMHVCAWGEQYTEKLLSYLIPSLLSANNVPEVCKQLDVRFWISCDQLSYEKCKSSPVIDMLSKYVSIVYDVIPDNIFSMLHKAESSWIERALCFALKRVPSWKYHLLGSMQNVATKLAIENRAYISYLMPDILMSDSALCNMFESLGKDRVSVAVTAFRSSTPKVKFKVEKYRENFALSIPAADLAQICVETMHKSAQSRIIASYNDTINITAQLIYSYPDKIVVRAFHYHPMLVDVRNIRHEVKLDYLPVDNTLFYQFISNQIPFEDQVFVNESTSYISVMEISDDGVESVKAKSSQIDINFEVNRYVNSQRGNLVNSYLYSKRCIYDLHRRNYNLLSDIVEYEI